MKLKNNKGFAVSTLLYGLSIMGFLIVILLMSIMSSNRVNTKDFVNQIEEDLNRYSLTEVGLRPVTDNGNDIVQEYVVPYDQAGWYKIELWGAAGASKGSYAGGNGAYTSGIIYLDANTHLYFYVGTKGEGNTGGKNNGGAGNATVAAGGGATDVRLESGPYNNDRSLKTRIMVAAGGGGASATAGGKGGDLQGYKGNGTVGAAGQMAGNFGVQVAPGGGAGYNNGATGEGGSSYISGYAGSRSYKLNTSNFDEMELNTFSTTDDVTINYQYPVYDPNNGSITGYNPPVHPFNFLNGLMVPGANSGDGKASIQRVDLTGIDISGNKKINLNGITRIVDCVDGANTSSTWKEIQAISNGVNVVKSGSGNIVLTPGGTDANKAKDGLLTTSATITASATEKCLTVNFNTAYNLDEIAVWHTPGNIAKHSLKACTNSSESSCTVLSNFNAIDNDPIVETTNGLHYSAYRNNTSLTPPNGLYYIVPVNNSSTVFTTGDSNLENNNMIISLKGIDGNKYQKWSLENVSVNTFIILENQNYNSLQIDGIGNVPGDAITASSRLIDSDRERWIITPTTNGQYVITSPLMNPPTCKLGLDSGALRTVATSLVNQSTKFYLINIDY